MCRQAHHFCVCNCISHIHSLYSVTLLDSTLTLHSITTPNYNSWHVRYLFVRKYDFTNTDSGLVNLLVKASKYEMNVTSRNALRHVRLSGLLLHSTLEHLQNCRLINRHLYKLTYILAAACYVPLIRSTFVSEIPNHPANLHFLKLPVRLN